MSGLDPDGPPAPGANLDAHVAEVVALLDVGAPAVLVGHSYGGSVITGAADRRPSQVTGLLYLDAFVPDDGDSCWSLNNDEQRDWYSRGAGATGLAVEPLPFFDRRARPHPLGTLMQRSTLTGAHKTIARRYYVLAAGADWVPHSPFPRIADALRGDSGWIVTDLDSGHNLLAKGPDKLVGLILGLGW